MDEFVLMLVIGVCRYPSIHPSTRGRFLLEVSVIRKRVDILLDHFVAELVLLLRNQGKRVTDYNSYQQRCVR